MYAYEVILVLSVVLVWWILDLVDLNLLVCTVCGFSSLKYMITTCSGHNRT